MSKEYYVIIKQELTINTFEICISNFTNEFLKLSIQKKKQ